MRVTWNEFEKLVGNLHKQITTDSFKPDCIVGVAAGGLVPLYCLAKSLGVQNILTITSRSYNEKKRGTVELLHVPNIAATRKKVLLVDDIAHSGESLKIISELIQKRWKPKTLKTATLFVNSEECEFVPDYVALKTKEGVHFPWEVFEIQIPADKESSTDDDNRPVAYLAGDWGFREDTRDFYYRVFIPMVRTAGFEIIDPWALTPKEKFERIARIKNGEKKRQAQRRLSAKVRARARDQGGPRA